MFIGGGYHFSSSGLFASWNNIKKLKYYSAGGKYILGASSDILYSSAALDYKDN